MQKEKIIEGSRSQDDCQLLFQHMPFLTAFSMLYDLEMVSPIAGKDVIWWLWQSWIFLLAKAAITEILLVSLSYECNTLSLFYYATSVPEDPKLPEIPQSSLFYHTDCSDAAVH